MNKGYNFPRVIQTRNQITNIPIDLTTNKTQAIQGTQEGSKISKPKKRFLGSYNINFNEKVSFW